MLAAPMARDLGVPMPTVFAAFSVALGLAQAAVSMFAAWALIGLAMGSGPYEAAFAALVRLYHESRNPITGITLRGGFASTVGCPLPALLEMKLGWRGTGFTWAALHLLLGLWAFAALMLLPRERPAAAAVPAATI